MEDMYFSIPCILCRDDAIGVSPMCRDCSINNFIEEQTYKWPVSIKDLEKKWKAHSQIKN
jgi:hypothetical protein